MAAVSVAAACGSEDTTAGSSSSSSQASSSSAGSRGANGGANGAGGGGAGGGLSTFTAEDLDTAGENAADANTGDVVAAVQAFMGLLTQEEKDTVSYDMSDHLARQTWSNYPAFVVPRNGIALGVLSESARAAALTVVRTMLSEQGYQQIQDVLAADDWLSTNSASGQENFGSGNYYLAVFSTPASTEAFAVQFGGHHIARNYTYLGTTASVTPHFTGTEPKSFSTSDGSTLAPMASKADAIYAVFDSLDTQQVNQAQLADDLEDLVMGPGADTGVFPASDGLLVSAMSATQRQLVLEAITAWSGDAATGLASFLASTFDSQLDQTYVAFSNSFDVDAENTYLRLDGPRVWIELINTRSQSTSGVHYHSVYRDKADDYGSTNPST